MKENFDKCMSKLLVHEGGFVNHPADPGGKTNMGITARTYADYLGRRLDTITEQEMRNLTVADVSPIYKRKYWNACKCDQLASGVDYVIFDYAVNSGVKRAIVDLQRSLAVADDGIFGPITLKYAKEANPVELIKEISVRRLEFLKGLKTFKIFGRGWTRRVSEVEKYSLFLAQE